MGQYQQWLQHREIDQLLHTQLKALVKELAQVDEQISLLMNNALPVDNMIIQALLKEFQEKTISVSDTPVLARFPQLQSFSTDEVTSEHVMNDQDHHSADPVSAALFLQERLPHFVSQDMQVSTGPEPITPIPISAENLLSPDIQAFVQAHSSATQQTNSIFSSQSILSNSPVDQQSIRVNQVVERWFERRTSFSQKTDRNQEEQKESML